MIVSQKMLLYNIIDILIVRSAVNLCYRNLFMIVLVLLFCYPLDGDFENVLSGKLVYKNISGENQKNLAFPASSASLYREVQYLTGDFIEQYIYSRPLVKNSSALFVLLPVILNKKLKENRRRNTRI